MNKNWNTYRLPGDPNLPGGCTDADVDEAMGVEDDRAARRAAREEAAIDRYNDEREDRPVGRD